MVKDISFRLDLKLFETMFSMIYLKIRVSSPKIILEPLLSECHEILWFSYGSSNS